MANNDQLSTLIKSWEQPRKKFFTQSAETLLSSKDRRKKRFSPNGIVVLPNHKEEHHCIVLGSETWV